MADEQKSDVPDKAPTGDSIPMGVALGGILAEELGVDHLRKASKESSQAAEDFANKQADAAAAPPAPPPGDAKADAAAPPAPPADDKPKEPPAPEDKRVERRKLIDSMNAARRRETEATARAERAERERDQALAEALGARPIKDALRSKNAIAALEMAARETGMSLTDVMRAVAAQGVKAKAQGASEDMRAVIDEALKPLVEKVAAIENAKATQPINDMVSMIQQLPSHGELAKAFPSLASLPASRLEIEIKPAVEQLMALASRGAFPGEDISDPLWIIRKLDSAAEAEYLYSHNRRRELLGDAPANGQPQKAAPGQSRPRTSSQGISNDAAASASNKTPSKGGDEPLAPFLRGQFGIS
jgi:hypothetical protein